MLLLTLVSASSSHGRPANADLVFNLDTKGFPDFSKIEIWKNGVENPLRDRLLIEWLFSHRPANEQLAVIVSRINQNIKRLHPERKTDEKVQSSWPTLSETGVSETDPKRPLKVIPEENPRPPSPTAELLVKITCSNGVYHSPCFVEKIREIYQRDRTNDTLLTIRTQHSDILSKSQRKNKKFLWQRTKVPTMYVRDIQVFTNARTWTNLDDNVSSQIEEAFQHDPYCSVQVNKVNNIDFESGLLYDVVKRKSYLIRSTYMQCSSKTPLVTCRFVGDEAYKKAVKRFDAAGILFYSVHPITGEAVFLLGHMTYSCRSWCDFGGLKDWKKYREQPRHTAARECFEETLGLFGSASSLRHQLEDYKTNNAFKVVNEVYSYVSHFLRIPFRDYPDAFQEVTFRPIHWGKLEMNEIRWFSMAAMRESVKMALDNQTSFPVSYIKMDGSLSSAVNPLREEFVHTMCIADKLGILNSIEYITQQLYISSLSHSKPPFLFSKTKSQSSKEILKTQLKDQHSENAIQEDSVGVKTIDLRQKGDGVTRGVSVDSESIPKNTLPHTSIGSEASSLPHTSIGSEASSLPHTSIGSEATSLPHTSGSNTPPDTGGPDTSGAESTIVQNPTIFVPKYMSGNPQEEDSGEESLERDSISPHSALSSSGSPGSSCSEDCETSKDVLRLVHETVETEDANDLEIRPRLWSFEAFLESVSHEKQVEKDVNLQTKRSVASRVAWSSGSKKKRKNNFPMFKGKSVMYYGMGAGHYGM